MSDLVLHETKIHPALVCPKCAAKIASTAARIEQGTYGGAFELVCLSCHTTVLSVDLSYGGEFDDD